MNKNTIETLQCDLLYMSQNKYRKYNDNIKLIYTILKGTIKLSFVTISKLSFLSH